MLFLDSSKQGYTPIELRRCLRGEDFARYKISESEIEGKFKEISEKFYNSNFSIENLIVTDLQGNNLFIAPTLYDKITIRRTDNILKRTLNFGVFSRDDEVRQAINLLKTENNGFVFRCDIEKFFESVNFSRAIDLLQANNFSNQIVIEHLRSIARHCENKGVSGLPK